MRFPRLEDTLQEIAAHRGKTLFLTAWDLTAAYHQLPVMFLDTLALCFRHRKTCYASSSLNFGGVPSPGRFNMFSEALMTIVTQRFAKGAPAAYPNCGVVVAKALLDDFLVVIEGPEPRARALAIQIETFILTLGVKLNHAKTQRHRKRLTYAGMVLDVRAWTRSPTDSAVSKALVAARSVRDCIVSRFHRTPLWPESTR